MNCCKRSSQRCDVARCGDRVGERRGLVEAAPIAHCRRARWRRRPCLHEADGTAQSGNVDPGRCGRGRAVCPVTSVALVASASALRRVAPAARLSSHETHACRILGPHGDIDVAATQNAASTQRCRYPPHFAVVQLRGQTPTITSQRPLAARLARNGRSPSVGSFKNALRRVFFSSNNAAATPARLLRATPSRP